MRPPPEKDYIFAEKHPWMKACDDKIHVIFYYQLKKSRLKSKTQITPK